MTLRFGRTQYDCPLLLLAIDKPPYASGPVWILGRLYSGYVGLIWIIPHLFEITVWIHKMQAA